MIWALPWQPEAGPTTLVLRPGWPVPAATMKLVYSGRMSAVIAPTKPTTPTDCRKKVRFIFRIDNPDRRCVGEHRHHERTSTDVQPERMSSLEGKKPFARRLLLLAFEKRVNVALSRIQGEGAAPANLQRAALVGLD